jgi:hypothetical protein
MPKTWAWEGFRFGPYPTCFAIIPGAGPLKTGMQNGPPVGCFRVGPGKTQ